MTRVIVHPGFHKTGTSSLQTYLTQHRATLCPHFAFYGKDDFLRAGAAARLYAQRPFRWRLWAFRRRLDWFLATIPDAPVIVLSRETFSGSMPGHRRISGKLITGYHDVAVPLGHQINAALRGRFGPDVQITYFYTLRDREDWIRSVYGHLLRSIHLTCDFDAFRAQFPDLIDPVAEAMRITRDLGITDVHCADLHDIGHRRAGPASALLDLTGVPAEVQDALPPAPRANTGEDLELQKTFLALNRAGLSKAALKRRKEDLRRQAN